MVTQENEFLLSIRNKIKNNFISIINSNLDDGKKIKKIENLLETDNTQEEIVLQYLILNKNVNSNNLIELLKKYENAIQEENFNLNFGKFYHKISSFQKIINLLNNLADLYNTNNNEMQINKINNIIISNSTKYIATFPIFYKFNYELYFYYLYYLFIKQIKKKYQNNKSKSAQKNLYEIIEDIKKNTFSENEFLNQIKIYLIFSFLIKNSIKFYINIQIKDLFKKYSF